MIPLDELASPERFHPRVEAALTVRVDVNGRAFLAKTRDLSMDGVFLIGKAPVNVRRLVITLPLPGGREIVTGADVKRYGTDGLAVQFDQLDWDDLIALARYLAPRIA